MSLDTPDDLNQADSSDDYTVATPGDGGTGAVATRLAEADKQLEHVADVLDDHLAESALERARVELAYARGHVDAVEAER